MHHEKMLTSVRQVSDFAMNTVAAGAVLSWKMTGPSCMAVVRTEVYLAARHCLLHTLAAFETTLEKRTGLVRVLRRTNPVQVRSVDIVGWAAESGALQLTTF